jgi:hypothetical protein
MSDCGSNNYIDLTQQLMHYNMWLKQTKYGNDDNYNINVMLLYCVLYYTIYCFFILYYNREFFIYDALKCNPDNNTEIDQSVPVKYEDKYLEKYNKLEDTELTQEKLDALKNSIVMEYTPLGNVIMFYDNKRETFTYYSDATIPYRYLEVVSRKYVTTYNCKKIYVNMDLEIQEAKRKIEEQEESIKNEKKGRNEKKEENN